MCSSASPETTLKLTGRDWDKLINLIRDGNVVPVTGWELLQVPSGNGQQPLFTEWGRVLAQQANEAAPECNEPFSLYQVSNRLSQTLNKSDLAYEMDDVIRQMEWPMPASLMQLAEITSFSLYINTTIDHLLKQALQKARAKQGDSVRELIFTPTGVEPRNEVARGLGVSPRTPTVFQLFGATARTEVFAETEDDLIEYGRALLGHDYAPQALYDYLQNKTLLLLGCGFPDWLGRFLLHALNAANIYYVSGRHEPGLESFLKRRKGKALLDCCPVAFTHEIHRRWSEQQRVTPAPLNQKHALGSPPPPFKRGAVFLSYAHEDHETVVRLRDQLKAANIDTWMDERELGPGDPFMDVIHENIVNASFFIPIVSNTHALTDRQARFVWREWNWAVDASLERREGAGFLQPVVIDDTPNGTEFIPRSFRKLHWTRLSDGRLPEKFVQFLSQGIRDYRRPK